MNSPFQVVVRSGPVKMATIECVRTESGVKLLSVSPQTGPAPRVDDIINKEFDDVKYARAAVRYRWSKDRQRLAARIRLSDKIHNHWLTNKATVTGAYFEDEKLVAIIDDGNAVIELTLSAADWSWTNPTDKGLRHGAEQVAE